MATKNLKIAEEPAPKSEGDERSPERRALADAIAARDTAARAAAAAHDAVARARQMVEEAETLLYAARQAVETAKTGAAVRLAEAAAAGGGALAEHGTRAARIAEQDAADNLDAARAALAQLEESVDGPERTLRQENKVVAEAARAVMRAETTARFERLRMLVEKCRADIAICSYMVRYGIVDDADPRQPFGRHMDPLRRQGPSADFLRSVSDLDNHGHPAIAPWKNALEQLQHNADVALPD